MALLNPNIPKEMVFDITVCTPVFNPETLIIIKKLEVVKKTHEKI